MTETSQQGQSFSPQAITNMINNQSQEITGLKLALEEMKVQLDQWRSRAQELEREKAEQLSAEKDDKALSMEKQDAG